MLTLGSKTKKDWQEAANIHTPPLQGTPGRCTCGSPLLLQSSLRPTSPKSRESPGEQLSHAFSITYFNSWLQARPVPLNSLCVLTELRNCSASGITQQLLMGVIKSLGGDLYLLLPFKSKLPKTTIISNTGDPQLSTQKAALAPHRVHGRRTKDEPWSRGPGDSGPGSAQPEHIFQCRFSQGTLHQLHSKKNP